MKIKNEWLLITIVLVPFVYLATIWHELPERVPMHWNIQGEIDRYGNRAELILIPLLLPLLIYLIFLVVPLIDPKNKIGKTGQKYQRLKTWITAFMSILAMVIIYSAKNRSLANPNYIILALGVIYIIVGNYLQTVRPNYFIGIRTPWTLENQTVWKDTHRIAGKLWFAGGFLIVISSLVFAERTNLIVFLIITGILTVASVLYSYFRFRKISGTAHTDSD